MLKINKFLAEKKGKGVNNLQRNVSWQADMTADELNALERYKEGRDSGLFMIKELKKQVEEGILEPVLRNSGPTPWISNLVIVPKDRPVTGISGINSGSGGARELSVRLTCDSKAVNKAIKRTRFPSKTIEDLVFEVNALFSHMFCTLYPLLDT